jgi:hypothetical protein
MSSFEPNEEKLAKALREAEGRREVFIPRGVDDRVLHAARGHFEKPRVPQWRRVLRWAIVCSIVVLAFLGRGKADGDLNRDGEVNIADAMLMARAGNFEKAEEIARLAVRIE